MNANTTSVALKSALAALVSLGLLAGCESPTRELPAEKQAILKMAEQHQHLALQNEAPPNPAGQPPPELATPPDPEWQTGIIEGHAAPFSGSVFQLENQWQQVLGERHVNVYAGALGEDRQQGVVIVQTTHVADLAHPSNPVFVRSPARTGALRIVEERGALLTLRALDGSTYTFDVASASFK